MPSKLGTTGNTQASMRPDKCELVQEMDQGVRKVKINGTVMYAISVGGNVVGMGKVPNRLSNQDQSGVVPLTTAAVAGLGS